MQEHKQRESKTKKIDLVLFNDIINLFDGVGGNGKQSFTRHASTLLDYPTFQITPGRNYWDNYFLADLRSLCRRCGVLSKPITFIFTYNEVKNESFVESINNILTTGEVGNLFSRDTYKAPLVAVSDENVWNYLLGHVKCNLHVILCFYPVG
jgi:dynein heavy chain